MSAGNEVGDPSDGAESSVQPEEETPVHGESSAESEIALELDGSLDEELAELLIEEESDVVTRERDEYLDALRRLQAEFDNYRKRMVRQQSESIERATESLLERLLPALDALDLALTHSKEEESAPDRQALIQIAALLRDTLAKEGLERIDAVEVEFDPSMHDAVMHLPAEESASEHTPDGVVVDQVMRVGYRLKGKVVRPAMVQVRG
jgi:molecular chaperone GrpE